MTSRPSESSSVPRALLEAWRADRASAAELSRGYRRFANRPRRRHASLRLAYWLFAGLLLGVSLAQAATSAPWHWWGIGTRSKAELPPSRRAAPTRTAPAPAAASPDATAVDAPTPVSSAKPAPEPKRGVAVSPTSSRPATPVVEQWQRAASALRGKDFAKANQALLDVERSATGGERDAARLARAQLLSSNGSVAEATRLLDDLQQRAQSELVRRKARELLLGLSQSVAGHRSATPGPDTQQP